MSDAQDNFWRRTHAERLACLAELEQISLMPPIRSTIQVLKEMAIASIRDTDVAMARLANLAMGRAAISACAIDNLPAQPRAQQRADASEIYRGAGELGPILDALKSRGFTWFRGSMGDGVVLLEAWRERPDDPADPEWPPGFW